MARLIVEAQTEYAQHARDADALGPAAHIFTDRQSPTSISICMQLSYTRR